MWDGNIRMLPHLEAVHALPNTAQERRLVEVRQRSHSRGDMG